MPPRCDPKARQVAQLVQRREQPELAVLFGSRARGDHNELESDIDVLLVLPAEPDESGKRAADRAAWAAAQAAYGRAVPVQLVWRTLESFRHNRRYTNSVETNAMREGFVMPRNPDQYRAADYEDEETEYEYSWTNYDNRMLHAESHLSAFILSVEHNQNDLVIGQQAQNALEHGLKALLEAHGAPYRGTHQIGELLGNVRRHDPELRDFRLSIPPDIYTEYAGESAYHERRRHPLLTAQDDYRNRTVADVQLIINRARSVHDQRRQNE